MLSRLRGWSRRGAVRALPLALAFALGSAWPVFGQIAGANGQLAVRSDGFVFWIEAGQKHVVYPATLSDEQINALPEGIPLNASLAPLTPAGSPTPRPPQGTSRADRLPLGQICQCYLVRGTGQRIDLQITVTSVDRDAWNRIRQTSPSNQQPREGTEYVMATVRVRYVSGPNDLPVSVDRFDFTMLDANDTLHTPAFVVEPQSLVSQTVFPGSEVVGSVTFQVPRGDPDPVLVWRYNDDNARWFGIR